ncbi:MAG: CoA pyrophosphatase [Anaerovoracaceae bacterium]
MNIDDIEKVYSSHKPKPIGAYKFFSVLVPFVEKEGKLNLLYEVRAKNMKSQPGEICFPGGHIEGGETPEHCAKRETCEELGIETEKISIVGQGDTLYGYANFTLFTFIGIINYQDYLNCKIQKDEVDEVFLVPIEELLKIKPEKYNGQIEANIDKDFPYESVGISTDYPWRESNWPIPIYEIDNRVIWGMTARITENVVNTIVEA